MDFKTGSILVGVIGILVFHTTSIIAVIDSDVCDLKLLFTVWRHGDRAPVITWPQLEYDFTQTSLGMLTTKGKDHMFNVGLWLRKRYDAFLSEAESSGPLDEAVVLRSTEVNRALASGMLVVAGMFPPTPKMRWNSNNSELGQIWQPLTFETVPTSEDYLLQSWESDCPRIINQLHRLTRRYEKDNPELYAKVFQGTKIPNVSMKEIGQIGDALMIAKGKGKSIPSWANGLYPDKFVEAITTWLLYAVDGEGKSRFATGPLFHEILTASRNFTKGLLPPTRKLYAYSGHAENIGGMMVFLNFNFSIFPADGPIIMFELRQCQGREPGLVALYHDDSTELQQIPLNCSSGSPCPLDEFQKRFGDNIVSQEEMLSLCFGAAVRYRLHPVLSSAALFLSIYTVCNCIF